MEVKLATVGFPEAPAVGLSAQPPRGLQGNRAKRCPHCHGSFRETEAPARGPARAAGTGLNHPSWSALGHREPAALPQLLEKPQEAVLWDLRPPHLGPGVRPLQPGSTLMGRDLRDTGKPASSNVRLLHTPGLPGPKYQGFLRWYIRDKLLLIPSGCLTFLSR